MGAAGSCRVSALEKPQATLGFPGAGHVRKWLVQPVQRIGVDFRSFRFKFGPLAATRMACMENGIGDQEDRYLESARRCNAIRIAWREIVDSTSKEATNHSRSAARRAVIPDCAWSVVYSCGVTGVYCQWRRSFMRSNHNLLTWMTVLLTAACTLVGITAISIHADSIPGRKPRPSLDGPRQGIGQLQNCADSCLRGFQAALQRRAHQRRAIPWHRGERRGIERTDCMGRWTSPRNKSGDLLRVLPDEVCPNIRPAFKTLQSLGFKNIRVLLLPQDFATDWRTKAFPTTRESKQDQPVVSGPSAGRRCFLHPVNFLASPASLVSIQQARLR